MVEIVSQDILVPTDFGPGSRLALERAIRSLGPEGGTICARLAPCPVLIVPEKVVSSAIEPAEDDASYAS